MDQLSRVFNYGIDSILATLFMFSIVVCPNVTFGVTCNRPNALKREEKFCKIKTVWNTFYLLYPCLYIVM